MAELARSLKLLTRSPPVDGYALSPSILHAQAMAGGGHVLLATAIEQLRGAPTISAGIPRTLEGDVSSGAARLTTTVVAGLLIEPQRSMGIDTHTTPMKIDEPSVATGVARPELARAIVEARC